MFDRHIIINTDHKPLERLLSHKSNFPLRIERWILHLRAYNYTIRYIPGYNNPAVLLSRNMLNSIEFTRKSVIQKAKEYINMIAQNTVPKALTQQEVKEARANDTTESNTKRENIQMDKRSTIKKFVISFQ